MEEQGPSTRRTMSKEIKVALIGGCFSIFVALLGLVGAFGVKILEMWPSKSEPQVSERLPKSQEVEEDSVPKGKQDRQPDEHRDPPIERDPPPIKGDPPPPPVVLAKEVRSIPGFDIGFFGCKTVGNETVCSFEITNKMQHRKLSISGGGIRNGAGVIITSYSRIIGADGLEYRASWAEAANNRSSVSVDHLFYSGIPTRARIAFGGLPEDVSTAALLLIHFGNSPLQYKNVVI